MKKSEIREMIKEELNAGKEYIVWGIPKGKTSEEVLYTKAKSDGEAKKVAKLLSSKYGITKARVQILDLTTKPEFSQIFTKGK